MNLKTRLKALERRSREVSGMTLRVLVSGWGPPNLANSKCTRRLTPNGGLMEIVTLDGDADALAEGDLERFIASFPIEGGL
jgi:hypothetical protein